MLLVLNMTSPRPSCRMCCCTPPAHRWPLKGTYLRTLCTDTVQWHTVCHQVLTLARSSAFCFRITLSQSRESKYTHFFMGVHFHLLVHSWHPSKVMKAVGWGGWGEGSCGFLMGTHWLAFLGPFPAPVLFTVQSLCCSLIRSLTEIMYLPRFSTKADKSTQRLWIVKYQNGTVFSRLTKATCRCVD